MGSMSDFFFWHTQFEYVIILSMSVCGWTMSLFFKSMSLFFWCALYAWSLLFLVLDVWLVVYFTVMKLKSTSFRKKTSFPLFQMKKHKIAYSDGNGLNTSKSIKLLCYASILHFSIRNNRNLLQKPRIFTEFSNLIEMYQVNNLWHIHKIKSLFKFLLSKECSTLKM